MSSTASAAATGLPSAIHALNPMPRRGFLAGLTKLSLVGGSVALIGQPSAVAEPATPEMIEAYKTWLALELRFLAWRMADDLAFHQCYRLDPRDSRKTRSDAILSCEWYVGQSAERHDDPYAHAALVMSAAECDWRDREKISASQGGPDDGDLPHPSRRRLGRTRRCGRGQSADPRRRRPSRCRAARSS